MITVKQLIKALEVYDPELPIITAKDDEGNGYNAGSLPGLGYTSELDQYWIDDVRMGSDLDEIEEKPNCVVL